MREGGAAGPFRHELPALAFRGGHHSLYSSGPHGDTAKPILWYWDWRLREEVDVYLSGHNHSLEHLNRQDERTEYFVSGTGGVEGPGYRTQGSSAWKSSLAQNRFRYGHGGFAWFDVTESALRVRFYDGEGNVLYEFEKRKG